MSYALRIIELKVRDNLEIHLIRGTSSEGVPTYTYLALHADVVKDMQMSLMVKTTDLEEYGVVLASGEGEPDEDTRQYIAGLLA